MGSSELEELAWALFAIYVAAAGTAVLGLISSWFAFRRARRRWSLVFSLLAGVGAVCAGCWWLSIGFGYRFFGAWAVAAGAGALIRPKIFTVPASEHP